MSITGGDIKFVASERMVDDFSTVVGIGGGGRMVAQFIVDGTENNAFPDVMPGDRLSGVEQFRRIFMGALSADNGLLAGAYVGLNERPSDPNVELVLLSGRPANGAADYYNSAYFTNTPQLRASNTAFLSWQARYRVRETPATLTGLGNCNATNASNNLTNVNAPIKHALVGDKILLALVGAAFHSWRTVTAAGGDQDAGTGTLTFDGPPWTGPTTGGVILDGYKREDLHELDSLNVPATVVNTHPTALSLTTAGVSGGASTLAIDKMMARVILTPDPGHVGWSGIDGAGNVPLYFEGDRVLVLHATTPATVWEWATVERVNYVDEELTFVDPLTNAYPTGSKVIRPIELGPLQAAVAGLPFMQQTWLRAWASSAVGAPPTGRYTGLVGLVNDGAITDRWAAVMKSGTQFDMMSERFGVIGSGNIATDYSPLNPMTGQPYFTLYASGWSAGLVPGNAFRFDTNAAAAPLWLLRITLPSSPSGTDQGELFGLGGVDA